MDIGLCFLFEVRIKRRGKREDNIERIERGGKDERNFGLGCAGFFRRFGGELLTFVLKLFIRKCFLYLYGFRF